MCRSGEKVAPIFSGNGMCICQVRGERKNLGLLFLTTFPPFCFLFGIKHGVSITSGSIQKCHYLAKHKLDTPTNQILQLNTEQKIKLVIFCHLVHPLIEFSAVSQQYSRTELIESIKFSKQIQLLFSLFNIHQQIDLLSIHHVSSTLGSGYQALDITRLIRTILSLMNVLLEYTEA